jgi:SAM-dependent methyltransferase
MSTARPSLWEQRIASDPEHSRWYAERFRQMAAQGADLAGEARLVDAMVPRGARILDAGCGPGRVGGYLHAQGHVVVGVDVDPYLIESATQDHPGPTWLVDDIAEMDLPAQGIAEPFDLIVCAGNVVTFLAPGTLPDALERMRAHTAPDGRIVVGFGLSRGLALGDFLDHAREVGLGTDLLLGTWDMRPFTAESDFVVAVLSR